MRLYTFLLSFVLYFDDVLDNRNCFCFVVVVVSSHVSCKCEILYM